MSNVMAALQVNDNLPGGAASSSGGSGRGSRSHSRNSSRGSNHGDNDDSSSSSSGGGGSDIWGTMQNAGPAVYQQKQQELAARKQEQITKWSEDGVL
jgi:hypothetical protein